MNLDKRFNDAERIFIGEIVNIEPSPSAASGVAVVFRYVDYLVIGTVKGATLGRQVRIAHYVVSDTRDMQPSDTQNPDTPFRKNAVHMVFAVEEDDIFNPGQTHLEEFNSDEGILELSDNLVKGLRSALGPKRTLFGVLRWLFFGR